MEFSQYQNTDQLLDLAIEEAHKWETPLGKASKGQAQKAFEALKKGKLALGHPQAHTRKLDPNEFEASGIALAPEIARSIKDKDGYVYYTVPVPALLFPGRGAQYRLVECQLSFKAGTDQRQPAIHAIFPEPYWKPILAYGAKFDLALDSEFHWGVELNEAKVDLSKLDAKLAGKVNNNNKLAGFIKVIPFEHTLGRMEIEAQYSSETAMWRLDSKQVIRSQKHTRFVTLLKVPKEVKQVQISAVGQAEVSFDWLTAQVSHVLTRLSEPLQKVFRDRKGLPLQDSRTWTLDLKSK